MVEIAEKDLQDVVALLLDRPLGAGRDEIDGALIAGMLAADWGFWYTPTTNLAAARAYLDRAGLEPRERSRVNLGDGEVVSYQLTSG